VQGGGACPAVAQRKRGRAFCPHGARPGARTITNLSWEQEQKQKAGQTVPLFQQKSGKQLTHIVRVSG